MVTCPHCKRHVRGDACPRCGKLKALASLAIAGGLVSTLAACYGAPPAPREMPQPTPSSSVAPIPSK